jgi:hypothetical protein
MSLEWTSNGLRKEFLMPNQKAEETEEGLNCDGKVEWTTVLKLWGQKLGKPGQEHSNLSESSKEGHGSKRPVLPMMMMMMTTMT